MLSAGFAPFFDGPWPGFIFDDEAYPEEFIAAFCWIVARIFSPSCSRIRRMAGRDDEHGRTQGYRKAKTGAEGVQDDSEVP